MRKGLTSLTDQLISSLAPSAEAQACPATTYTYGPCVNESQKVTEHYYLVSDGLCFGPYTYTYHDYCL
jgi:hypothetical protein